MTFNWTCPYCNRDQSVIPTNFQYSIDDIKFSSGFDSMLATTTKAILCANSDCTRTTIELAIVRQQWNPSGRSLLGGAPPIFKECVLPRGTAKPQPDYIPKALVDDYIEASLIRELSPKASATLSRRCIQGMIRGFAKISKSRLVDEIKALKTAVEDGSAPRSVTIESVEAIDHVRKIGNIGAHMERDIDVIVDVDPDEAGVLLELIEMLFREWYVEQHNRESRLNRITALGANKEQQIADARAGQQKLLLPPEDE